ncbi:hypothetical protein CCZ01_09600 [Helicobacter monodelphidis]|uniref:hypothetical protein n=1 Tax=Helicobacter sp. 15-1451 TaxID=2004995 RepID=UPI000DCC8954|nr:hypothetical protein [Helicobacter sp. 15-1451]RAX56406.1 hypothetical protein CCZ01_09600 [Helicobacter sp. 15-1451]
MKIQNIAKTLIFVFLLTGMSYAQEGKGQIFGTQTQHTTQSLKSTMDYAWVTLPAKATGRKPFSGFLKDIPNTKGKVPVVIFMHGSSGINDAIKQWQQWAAQTMQIATITPDSMRLEDRMTYQSPIPKEEYEKIHTLRQSELQNAIQVTKDLKWVNKKYIILAGTSEGAVSIARYQMAENAPKEVARMIFSWSCEDNYMVNESNSHIPNDIPTLNIMSSTDKFFSPSNPYIGNEKALGHCGVALQDNKTSLVILMPNAPHTLFNLDSARDITQSFLKKVINLK